MINKSIMGVICAFLMTVSFNADAIPTSADWQSSGDGLITYDANTGLEWLELSYTDGRSYNDISSKFGIGMEFEGWRYATRIDVERLFVSLGGDGHYGYIDNAVNHSGFWDGVLATNWRILLNTTPTRIYGGGTSHVNQTSYIISNGMYLTTPFIPGSITISEYSQAGRLSNFLFLDGKPLWQSMNQERVGVGSYLIRNTAIPEPSVAILMTSGLIAFGLVRRKTKV